MLKNIFKEIKNDSKYFSQSNNGEEFENKFRNILKAEGYSEIVQKSKTNSAINEISKIESEDEKIIKTEFKNIKDKILEKNSIEIIRNPFKNIKDSFIFQPYGSQNFPDFIILTERYILPIEIKYSTNIKKQMNLNSFKPMWNSNLPKPNALYVYGIAGEKTTFFMGNDILEFDTREVLLDFFDNLDQKQTELNKKLQNLKNNFGIYPYVRKAYQHKSEYSTYIDVSKKAIIESYFSENSNKREENVLSFLDSIKNNE